MAKVKNPTTFSRHFKIDRQVLDDLGILDTTLAIDSKLFIDPLLLAHSCHKEINNLGAQLYRSHFEKVIKFLTLTSSEGDLAWRTARKLLTFPEIRGTCLGYGAATIDGGGIGPKLANQIIHVGKEIVDLGIRDPDLFPAMALFEENIGPDRISDMTTNVVWGSIAKFNKRILKKLNLSGEAFIIEGNTIELLRNPFHRKKTPIILIPKDILRVLQIANDWDEIQNAANMNDELRKRVNEHISHIWAAKTKRDKKELRENVMSSENAFQALLDAIHKVPAKSYNLKSDPYGVLKWVNVAEKYSLLYPLNLSQFRRINSIDDVMDVVLKIVDQYEQLIEKNGLNKELYKDNGKPRHESTSQRLFFAIAYSYCKANNVDISPEIDTGTGLIDFKFSKGFDSRVLVEIKLSSNGKLVHGYETQLEVYKQSQETLRAIYLVIDVGRMGKKVERLFEIRNEYSGKGYSLSELRMIDGIIKPSASKR